MIKEIDPGAERLKEIFAEFIFECGYEKENRLLIFFSGHGVYTKKRRSEKMLDYLIPIDAPHPRKNLRGFLRKALPMEQILSWSRTMEAKHALLLFDSCFSGMIFHTKSASEDAPFAHYVFNAKTSKDNILAQEPPLKKYLQKVYLQNALLKL